MRLIDADALKENLSESYDSLRKIYDGLRYNSEKAICSGQLATFLEAIMRIREAPTIDAEPVVRCKDCKQNLGIQGDFIECGYWLDIVKPNGFCSYGERRESDG